MTPDRAPPRFVREEEGRGARCEIVRKRKLYTSIMNAGTDSNYANKTIRKLVAPKQLTRMYVVEQTFTVYVPGLKCT